jgi:glycosyltransferase involved in cell wall biosynthesis
MKNKILIFNFVPYYGGADRCIIEMICNLREKFDFYVVSPDKSSPDYINALRLNRIKYKAITENEKKDLIGGKNQLYRILKLILKILHYIKLSHNLYKIIKQVNPNLICTHNFKSVFIFLVHPKLRGKKICLYLHGWYNSKQMTYFSKYVCRRRNIKIVTVSRATKTALISNGVSHRKIRVIYNPIDINYVIEESKKKLQNQLIIDPLSIKILLPAGIMYEKGQHIAIEAVSRLQKNGIKNIELLFCGEEYKIQNNNYIDKLITKINELELKDTVHFLGFRKDLYQIMRLSQIVILPSYSEGLPRIILEAMALKKPVIATPVGGITDLIIDNLTGLIMEIDDAQSLAGKLKLLIMNKELGKYISNNAFKLANIFTIKKFNQEMGQYLEDIINPDIH